MIFHSLGTLSPAAFFSGVCTLLASGAFAQAVRGVLRGAVLRDKHEPAPRRAALLAMGLELH
jgi:hypothetical protein